MRKLLILGVAVLGVTFILNDAMAQRGAIGGGMRGAAVGGLVGGKSGAATGAKVGVVTGATRSAVNRETQARTQYQQTPEYQNYQGANLATSQPETMMASEATVAASQPAKTSGEAVIRQDDKPIVGVTFPEGWKQRTGDNFISAVSPDGHAWSMFVAMKESDKQAALKKVEDGLQTYMSDIKLDERTEEKTGDALVVTGTGTGKKAGGNLVFAAGVFDAGDGQLVAAGFAADAKLEDHYKEAVKGICETIRRTKDFNNSDANKEEK
ncbi:hypothetical protein LOC68_10690 [Blastopirellula sp. JC732]|uniref:Uncharacterized protein n=1 Tax=Blastopirellula sediminis TaxID=2894196 RepID=A0A9X1ML57_9BACT|nr:hypothetical protein [Blastopirellula sediminis]MCC9608357.1 hypothetical protein [Blastopirellula sediminis]MCC9628866.1 hypothetical protein [Blastopirellula sediminis]